MSDPNPTTEQLTSDPNTDPNLSAGGEGESEVDKLRRALEASREEARRNRAEARQYQSQLKQVGETNPALLEEAQRKAEEAEQRRQLAEQQADLKVQQMQQKLQQSTEKTLNEARAAKEAAEREALRVKTERDFLAAEGLIEASTVDGSTPFDYVWRLFGERIAEDGQGRYLKDENGLPTLDPESGKRVTLKDFFGRLREDPVHGMHFKPRFGSGGGSRAGYQGRVGSDRDLSKLGTNELFREAFQAKR